jgi:Ca-activated chloride channel homolog
MRKRCYGSLCFGMICSVVLAMAGPGRPTQNQMVIRRTVDLVQLDVAVTGPKGQYISDLRPSNFVIYEDGIREKVDRFGEENVGPNGLGEAGRSPYADRLLTGVRNSQADSSGGPGHRVFILFDTSNYMYKGFVFAQDAISQFVQSLDPIDQVAFYSYSRDFSRGALLTPHRNVVVAAVRHTVAGDDAALYDSLLLTLKDAARFTGRKVVVVFSNGPDNASVIAPENVLELAQSEGVPIYMISTRAAKRDPVSSAVFERVSTATGGKVYFAKNWEEQQKAFASVRDDLEHLYSLSYYPQPNPNQGWRQITVRLTGVPIKKYHIRTRTGYFYGVARFIQRTQFSPWNSGLGYSLQK